MKSEFLARDMHCSVFDRENVIRVAINPPASKILLLASSGFRSCGALVYRDERPFLARRRSRLRWLGRKQRAEEEVDPVRTTAAMKVLRHVFLWGRERLVLDHLPFD